MDGVVERLESGAKCVDVGCGAAVATVTMAKAFPKSEFHGYDNSEHAVIVYRSGLTKGTGVLSGARRIDVTMSITRIPL